MSGFPVVEGYDEEMWRHGETGEDGSLIHPFDFFLADVRALPKLVANYDDKIDLLLVSIGIGKYNIRP